MALTVQNPNPNLDRKPTLPQNNSLANTLELRGEGTQKLIKLHARPKQRKGNFCYMQYFDKWWARLQKKKYV
jgi:hypothetical protein